MRVVICSVAIGGWYPKGIARMIQEFDRVSPGFEIQAFVNVLPFGSPRDVIEDGYEYTGYAAKPFALNAAMMSGADVAILIDASFYPVRPIHPLIDYIARNGYYLCDNGNKVGEWCSDRAAERMAVNRASLMRWTECSSYCVGLNFGDGRCHQLLQRWMGYASDRLTFVGPHTSLTNIGRNRGFVSSDPGVKGHRHDQTALSVIANQLGMVKFAQRPYLTAYKGSEDATTVLINQGLGS
jgi:hypothetical protein